MVFSLNGTIICVLFLNAIFQKNGRYYLRSRLDYLRRLLKTEKYTEALPEVITLYRDYRNLDVTDTRR